MVESVTTYQSYKSRELEHVPLLISFSAKAQHAVLEISRDQRPPADLANSMLGDMLTNCAPEEAMLLHLRQIGFSYGPWI